MSIRALNWVFSPAITAREDIMPSMRHILVVLANFADDDNQTFPKQSTIARITGLSRSTINSQIGRLCELDVISVADRNHDNGARTSSIYTLNLPAERDDILDEDERKGGVRNSDRGPTRNLDRGSPTVRQGVSDDTTGPVQSSDTLNHYTDPKAEPKANQKRKTAPWPADYREQFWKLYPKKPGDSRKEAWKKLDIIHRDDEVEWDALITGLGYYAARMNAEVQRDPSRKKYIVAATVWLNQARWETETPTDPTDRFAGQRARVRVAI